MLTIPEDYTEYPKEVMTNFDHTIDKKVAKLLKKEKLYAQYSGWDFHGNVWFNNKWYCMIKCYCVHRETIEADTLEEIMTMVSKKYGEG